MGTKVSLSNVRLAFAQIFEPKPFGNEGGEPAFSACFLFPPDSPNKARISEAIRAEAAAKWADKADGVLKALKAQDKLCLHNGDSKANYAGFEGQLFVSARGRTRPAIVDRDKTPLVAADGRPYSGCFVNVSLELWAQENSYGKRINASIVGIQFVKDGEAFAGGAVPSADDFEVLDEVEEGGGDDWGSPGNKGSDDDLV